MSSNSGSDASVKFSDVQKIINSYILNIEEKTPPVWGYSKRDIKIILRDLVKEIKLLTTNDKEAS